LLPVRLPVLLLCLSVFCLIRNTAFVTTAFGYGLPYPHIYLKLLIVNSGQTALTQTVHHHHLNHLPTSPENTQRCIFDLRCPSVCLCLRVLSISSFQ